MTSHHPRPFAIHPPASTPTLSHSARNARPSFIVGLTLAVNLGAVGRPPWGSPPEAARSSPTHQHPHPLPRTPKPRATVSFIVGLTLAVNLGAVGGQLGSGAILARDGLGTEPPTQTLAVNPNSAI